MVSLIIIDIKGKFTFKTIPTEKTTNTESKIHTIEDNESTNHKEQPPEASEHKDEKLRIETRNNEPKTTEVENDEEFKERTFEVEVAPFALITSSKK